MDFSEEHYFTNFHGALHAIENAKDFTYIDLELNNQQVDVGLKRFYNSKQKDNDTGFRYLQMKIDEARATILKSKLPDVASRQEAISTLEELVYEIFKVTLEPKSRLKLQMNADKDVIFHLIKQLKRLYIKPGVPFLSQDYETLARFFISNVEGFENNKESNLAKEMQKKREDMVKRRIKATWIDGVEEDEK